MARLAFLGVAALVSVACGAPERPRDGGAALDLRRYVPTAIGDRQRFENTPTGPSHVGITARTANGLAVSYGSDRVNVTFLDARVDSVHVTTPDGRRQFPMLLGPIGATHPFTLPDGNRCTLATRRHAEAVTVAGNRFDDCIEAERRCDRRVGIPQPTVTTELDVLCPGVGAVRRTFDANPPLPFAGTASHVESTLVGYRVAGAPRMRTGGLPERLIVLPSDVSAACGGTVLTSRFASSGPSHAKLEFVRGEGVVVIEATRAASGELSVTVTPDAACRATGAGQLEALARSLVAP